MISSQNNGFWKSFLTWITFLSLLIGGSVCIFTKSARAELNYGVAYSDIGTFQTLSGNLCLWVGWDANFSETYNPEGESYAWVVYFAPEAIYLALQSSKSVYSGVNVNAGFKYFYGALNIANGNRLTAVLLGKLRSVGLSMNSFKTPGIGVGPFSLGNLSFALSVGLTCWQEKATGILQRGIQFDSGVSISYDLILNPLPFSVSLGIDWDDSQFIGFYPIVIYNIEQQASQNPIDLLISELEKIDSSLSPQAAEVVTKKMLLKAIQIMQSNTSLSEFIESESHNSNYDIVINETQQWLQSGNTSNLPENLQLPDPAETHQTMKPIFSATQMAFELGYQRGCIANPSCDRLYADCVIEEYCTPGKECVIEITADEIAALIPGKTAADFEDAWLLIDNSVEQYLVSEKETTEWLQIKNGKATYRFMQNTETPIVLGVKIDPAQAPVDMWVELCRRVILFTSPEGDINSDEIIDLADAILALQTLTNIESLPPVNKKADTNADDKIGLEEVVYILQKVSGLRQ